MYTTANSHTIQKMATPNPMPKGIGLYLAAASPENTGTAATTFGEISIDDILSYKTPAGNTLLHVASLKGNLNIVQAILSRLSRDEHSITTTNSEGDTALHLAARSGKEAVVNELLHWREYNLGLSRATNSRGNTAAHEALIGGHNQTVQELVTYDPWVSMILNNEDKSVLYVAVEAGKLQLVKDMLEKAEPSELRQGKPLLYPAIVMKRPEMMDAILEKDKELICWRDGQGMTALHYAASVGYDDGVDYLIKKDSSCALERDNQGLFPVHHAARNGHTEILNKLLAMERNLDAEELLSLNGRNVFHEAAHRGKHDVIKLIFNTPSLEGLINQQDKGGNTPLHLATKSCKPKIVSMMTWDARVKLEIVNKNGLTAFDVAEDMINEHPNKFQTQLTLYALVSAGGTKAHRDEIPVAPRSGSTSNRGSYQGQEQDDRGDAENRTGLKDRANTLLLVATLIATVTFAAGFTVPGGYNSNSGRALLLYKKMFSVFIFCNSVALYCSITVAVTLIWAHVLVTSALLLALPVLGVALIMLPLAFMAGTYVTISGLSWIGIVALVMGAIFLIILVTLFTPLCLSLQSTNGFLRRLTYYPFYALILLTDSIEDSIEDKGVA
ncbi:hypothetical protein Droror1_Dr00015593 [Drosera rotundifolia]